MATATIANGKGNGATDHEAALNEVSMRAAELKDKATTIGLEEVSTEIPSKAGAILKHLEAIAERALHEQIAPLQRLSAYSEQMIAIEYERLARIKMELQTWLADGAECAALAQACQEKLETMSGDHATLINAATN